VSWVADFSFAHDAITGAELARIGAAGAIGYVSDHPEKNLTAANLRDLQLAGIPTALVFEDAVDDMAGNPSLGSGHGQVAVTQARAIGYDPESCTIFAADDRNTGPADWPNVLAYMDNYAKQVRWPGYYGDQDSIDWLAPQRPDWVYWQSDSMSFGNGVSRNAHLVQHYNDVRCQGLALDVSDIARPGVRWLGEDMFLDSDRATLNGIAAQIMSPAALMARISSAISHYEVDELAHLGPAVATVQATAAQMLTLLEKSSADDIAKAILTQLPAATGTAGPTAQDIAAATTAAFAALLAKAAQQVAPAPVS
jgi:hypothetical protein